MNRTPILLVIVASIASALAQAPVVTLSKDLDSTPGMDPVFIREIKLWKTLQADDYGAFKSNLSPDFKDDKQ